MTLILDGKKARDFHKARLSERVAALQDAHRPHRAIPRLVIIQVGENKASEAYIRQKKAFADAIGAKVDHIRFAESVSYDDVAAKIAESNADRSIHGIIVQLPIPAHLDRAALIGAIDPNKDVDGLTEGTRFTPATAKGIMMLLDFYDIAVKGKKAVVMGRSALVGRPTAELLRARGATVEVCHSKTSDPIEVVRAADILIIAIGKPKFVDARYIGSPDTVVVDVGITSVSGALVGDVDFDQVAPHVRAISPVPGGVGPMTVLALFDNLVLSAERLVAHNL